VCERASVRTMKSKSAAVNRARQFALIIGTSECAIETFWQARLLTTAMRYRNRYLCLQQHADFYPAWLRPRSGEVAKHLPLAGPTPQREQDSGNQFKPRGGICVNESGFRCGKICAQDDVSYCFCSFSSAPSRQSVAAP